VKVYQEILPICKAKFGPDARQTLQSMNNLAMGLYELEKYEDAIRIHQETLGIKKAKYGPDDRSTLTTMTNLANCYHSLHRYEDALKLRSETLELFTARFGPDDFDTLMVTHNVGSNLRALGRFTEALRLHEEALARRKTTLGVDHPDTLTSLWAVARDLIELDRGTLAIPLLDECLQRAVGKRVHRNFPEVADLRLRHFEKTKNAHECRTTAELWEKQERTDAESLYQAAVCRAVTAAMLKVAKPAGAGADRLANDEADLAMAWLVKAVAAGFDDKDRLAESKDFDLVRDRPLFRELIAKLERKVH
jgi:tetratricopeptide (TPR) repeat protein